MSYKRRVLQALSKSDLFDLAVAFELGPLQRHTVADLIDLLAKSKRATLEKVLPLLSRDALKLICRVVKLSDVGRDKQSLIDRIIGTDKRTADDDADEAPAATEPAQPDLGLAAPAPTPPKPRPEVPKPPPEAPKPPPEAPKPLPEAPPTPKPVVQRATETVNELAMTLDVEPRKPRLAWQGMDRREALVAVPTQVVEIVRPKKAKDTSADPLTLITAEKAGARPEAALPRNRLIWTNDNLVALQTLLDERDPVTRDFKYRGKVDLVYIDPPFMVNNDFRADNAIDIELDDEVEAKKEPSLVEILAYKDTWRQGLDSFLSMLRARLVLLKDLLAPTGSIYVHLDWHAVHYVKVLMDEVFGYENFREEIVWKRTFARSDSQGFNLVHDTIVAFSSSGSYFWTPVYGPHSIDYIKSHYSQVDPVTRRRFQLTSLESPNPRPTMMYEWKGYRSPAMGWRYSLETMQSLDAQGLINYPEKGGRPRFKRFLDDDGMPLQSIWNDISPVNSQAGERLGYPTQKPVALLERIIASSCPPGGLVLDCFLGSGTTAEAAERLGRHWIGIDNGKYAVHLARKRLIQLHGQPRPPEKPQGDYVECDKCGNIERKEKSQKSPGPYNVRPFTVENMGVYQRAEKWQDFQTQRSVYRDEMVRVFGGEPVNYSALLHGKKGNHWVHVGPLDAPIASSQVWSIAREAQRTDMKAVEILSADFDTLAGSEKDEILRVTGIKVTIRIIPAHAIDEVRRRLEMLRKDPDGNVRFVESMAIPAFYAPLSIVLDAQVRGRNVTLRLAKCEIDITSFIASQRPMLKPIADGMSASAQKKAQAEHDRWEARRKDLEAWLDKATTWQKFVDFWAVDWDYGRRVGADGKPIFVTDWQSFRTRKGKGEIEPLVFSAELAFDDPGQFRVAARVTDVFGNDGIATVTVQVQ